MLHWSLLTDPIKLKEVNMMQEASIIINGKELTIGQSMAVRVALNSFVSSLTEEGLGDDEIGVKITEGYVNNTNAVLTFIQNDCS